ncbi:hypothetical protein JMJ77_0003080 [Colletotrichum scovillei]|uniref:Uncharacterized protein n=1 Tax=Colletotrichum scovillei TaxID=1209932 RepID=A0A9P7U9T9_9PEZI|nr:hypothetical protein JMJ78_0006289 [Colletotrichum scovillei]KAG7043374.1 hypothetical protein JMJ77_0003080 [Colletotrichum scovillei]KAG7062822.1 hypothetical protein JMJ76_0009665 [Colletotrichum scovillei]
MSRCMDGRRNQDHNSHDSITTSMTEQRNLQLIMLSIMSTIYYWHHV